MSKRARTEEGEEGLRLNDTWAAVLLGRRTFKQKDLTAAMMRDRLISLREIEVVSLFTVDVNAMAGQKFDVVMNSTDNKVDDLKKEIEKVNGNPRFSQQLFVLSQTRQTIAVLQGQELLDNQEMTTCSVALCTRVAIGTTALCTRGQETGLPDMDNDEEVKSFFSITTLIYNY